MCAAVRNCIANFYHFWAPYLSSFALTLLLVRHFWINLYGPPGQVLEGNGVSEKRQNSVKASQMGIPEVHTQQNVQTGSAPIMIQVTMIFPTTRFNHNATNASSLFVCQAYAKIRHIHVNIEEMGLY
jgi:hypothetical protein